MDEETREEILSSKVYFVFDNEQALSVVESPSFATFCNSMNRYYQLPSRQPLVRALHDDYTAFLLKFRKLIEQISGRAAMIADGWSSRVMRGYFMVTIHRIDSD